MSSSSPREFEHRDGAIWRVEVVSHGRTSAYLNPRVHRPVLQFTSRDRPQARRYVSLPGPDRHLDELSDVELRDLLDRARVS